MTRTPILLGLLLLGGARASAAQAPERSGSWSAKTSSGLVLVGTWTAVADSAAGTVTGTWTLGDAEGRRVAEGAWSASTASARWSGAWRSVVAGRGGEYSGTWAADTRLRANASFVALFDQAIRATVDGSWRGGGRAGAWSIRTVAPDGPR